MSGWEEKAPREVPREGSPGRESLGGWERQMAPSGRS